MIFLRSPGEDVVAPEKVTPDPKHAKADDGDAVEPGEDSENTPTAKTNLMDRLDAAAGLC